MVKVASALLHELTGSVLERCLYIVKSFIADTGEYTSDLRSEQSRPA